MADPTISLLYVNTYVFLGYVVASTFEIVACIVAGSNTRIVVHVWYEVAMHCGSSKT